MADGIRPNAVWRNDLPCMQAKCDHMRRIIAYFAQRLHIKRFSRSRWSEELSSANLIAVMRAHHPGPTCLCTKSTCINTVRMTVYHYVYTVCANNYKMISQLYIIATIRHEV